MLDNKNSNFTFSTDTDYMFDLIANNDKINKNNNDDTKSGLSTISELSNNSDTSKKSNNMNSPLDKNNNSKKSYSPSFNLSPKKSNNKSNNKSNDIRLNITPRNSISPKSDTDINRTPIAAKSPVIDVKHCKQDLLKKLNELKMNGYTLTRNYSMSDSLEDMDNEYNSLKNYVDKKNGVKMISTSLVHLVSVVEFLNDKYDPFDFHLSGWSESISSQVNNWNDVLEEIYEKYKSSGRKLSPEIKLVYLILTSAAMFHLTSSFRNPKKTNTVENTSVTQKPDSKTNTTENTKKKSNRNNSSSHEPFVKIDSVESASSNDNYKDKKEFTIKKSTDVSNILKKIHNVSGVTKNKEVDITTTAVTSSPLDSTTINKKKRKGISLNI